MRRSDFSKSVEILTLDKQDVVENISTKPANHEYLFLTNDNNMQYIKLLSYSTFLHGNCKWWEQQMQNSVARIWMHRAAIFSCRILLARTHRIRFYSSAHMHNYTEQTQNTAFMNPSQAWRNETNTRLSRALGYGTRFANALGICHENPHVQNYVSTCAELC